MAYLTGSTVEKICKQAVRFMVTEMGAERALVVMRDEDVEQPQPVAHYGLDSTDIWDGTQISTTVLRKVFQMGEPVLVLDALGDGELNSRKSVLGGELRSILAVPVLGWGDQVEGLLYADHRARAAVFGPEDRDRLQKLACEFQVRYRSFQEPSPAYQARRLRWAVLIVWAVVLGVLGGLVNSGEMPAPVAAGAAVVLWLPGMIKRRLFPLPSEMELYADGALEEPTPPRVLKEAEVDAVPPEPAEADSDEPAEPGAFRAVPTPEPDGELGGGDDYFW